MKAKLLILSALWTITVVAWANIKGLTIDANTSEELIGASIRIKEYPELGTVTGLDGSFMLKDIPNSDRFTLVCSYMGYETQEIQIAITNKEGVLFKLESAATALDGVMVVASMDRRSDNNARVLEKNASNIINIVSAKSIELSPDLNVASVLQRMSGVTMERDNSGEAQYAVLRGMDKRYNYTLVNGVKIPSPDNKNRYVPLNMFPSELLDQLEVTKSLTADMEGDATGGAVNMIMKDAPNELNVQANMAVGYNTMYLNNDYAYFNNAELTAVTPRDAHGTDYTATMSDFGTGTAQIVYKTPMPNLIGGVSVGDRFFNKKLGLMVAGSIQNTYKNTNSVFFSDNMPQTESTVRVNTRKDRTYSERQMQYGAHAKLDYRINHNNKIEWYNALVGLENWQVRETQSTSLTLNYIPEEGNYDQTFETRSTYNQQQIFSSTLQGQHLMGECFLLDWSTVFSDARSNTPDKTYITLDSSTSNYVSYVTADNAERRWESNSDSDYSAYLNLSYKKQLSIGDITLKAGGMYRKKDRTNTYVTYRFTPADGVRPELGRDFTSIDEINWKVATTKGSVGPLNYDAGEDIGAGYLMGKWEQKKWQVVAGLRAEHTNQWYLMYHPNIGDEPAGGQNYWDLLPSIHFKYSPQSNMNLRASYYRSINRPGFFEIVPYSIINEDYTEYGNPELNRATIDNVDLRFELFPSQTEQILVGMFFKNIQDPIEEAYYTINNRQSGYGPANLGNAKNVGAEIDFIKQWRSFGVKANYTYTYSRIVTEKNTYYIDESGRTAAIKVDQARPLVNQAPHTANLSLMYKSTTHGWDAQLAGSYVGSKIVIASHFLDADYWEGANFSLDFSAEKRFDNGLSIFAKGNNLLDLPTVRYIKTTNEFNDRYDMQDSSTGRTLIRENRYGRTFLLGVRFKL